jgi:hypothetical protein
VTARTARLCVAGAAAAAAAALALGGCLARHRAPVPRPNAGDWAQQRDAATRRGLLYDGLRHRATGTATLLALPVREARARRLSEWLDWTPVELEDRLALERTEANEGEEFILAFYTADPKDNDLDAPRSVWRVAVKVDGGDVLARRITSIDRDATSLGLYPFVGPFDTIYRVFLPQAPGGPLAGREFTFELASARGKVSLDFGKPNGPITPQEPVPPP